MQLKMSNVRGVEMAGVPLDDVTLLAGGNRAGKTSVLQSLAMVASRTKTWPGLSQAQTCALLVRDGAKEARIELISEDGEVELVLNAKKGSIELSERGVPPYAPPMAVQLQRLTQMAPQARLVVLRAMMQADPSPETLEEALRSRPLVKNRDAVLKRVAQDGYDKVAEDMAADARHAKRLWEQVTGQRWSSSRGASWRPEAFPADPTTIEEDVAQLEVELAKYQGGASPELREHLQQQVDAFDGRTLAGARKRLATLATKLEELEAKNLAKSMQVLNCPECGSVLKLEFGKLVSVGDAEVIKPEELQKLQQELAKLRSEHNEASREVDGLLVAQRAAENAKERLAAMPTDSQPPPPDLIAELDKAKAGKRAMEQKIEADEHQGTIEQRLDLAELLGPDGLRKTVLVERLEELETLATALATVFQLNPVQIDEQGVMYAAGHLVEGLSRSEQYLVDVSIQLAVARMVQADLVVIDDLDIIEPKWKGILFELLRNAEVPVMVGMMSKLKRKDGSVMVPELSSAGMAPTLWIEGGRVMPLSAVT